MNQLKSQTGQEGSISQVQESLVLKKPATKPKNRYRYNQLLYNYFAQKNFEKAQELIEQIFKEHGEQHEFANLIQGYILKMKGQLNKSTDYFKNCLLYNEKDPEVLKTIAKNLQLTGRKKASVEIAQEALKLKQNDWELFYTLGNCYMAKDIKKAIDFYYKAFQSSVNQTTYTKLGKVLTAQDEYQEALKVYKQALQIFPQASDIKTYIAGVLLRIGQNEEAQKYLMQSSLSDPHTLLSLGSILQDVSKYDEALQYYRRLQASHPNSSHVLNNIGMCYYGKGQLLAAISCLRKAIYLNPFEWTIHYNMGLVNLASQQYASAFHYFQSSIQLNSEDATSFMYLGIALEKLNDYDNTKRAFQRALEIEKDYLIYLNYSIILANHQEIEESNQMFAEFAQQLQSMQDDTRCSKFEVEQRAQELKNRLGI